MATWVVTIQLILEAKASRSSFAIIIQVWFPKVISSWLISIWRVCIWNGFKTFSAIFKDSLEDFFLCLSASFLSFHPFKMIKKVFHCSKKIESRQKGKKMYFEYISETEEVGSTSLFLKVCEGKKRQFLGHKKHFHTPSIFPKKV